MTKRIKKIMVIIRSMLVYYIYFNSSILAFIPVMLFKLNPGSLRSNIKLAAAVSTFTSICVALLLIIIYRKDLIKEFRIFKKKILSCLNTGLIFWITGLIVMFAVNSILIFVFKSGGANNEKAIQKYISAAPLFMALDVCLIAPFNEEIVFRKAIRDVFSNKYIFVFFSFLIFGGCHVISSAKNIIDYLYIIPYGTLGAMFALAYNKTKTVYTSMTFHMLHNTILFLLSILV